MTRLVWFMVLLAVAFSVAYAVRTVGSVVVVDEKDKFVEPVAPSGEPERPRLTADDVKETGSKTGAPRTGGNTMLTPKRMNPVPDAPASVYGGDADVLGPKNDPSVIYAPSSDDVVPGRKGIDESAL